jgi:hypothetical protein
MWLLGFLILIGHGLVTASFHNYEVHSDGIWLAKGEPLNKQVVVSLLDDPGVNFTFTRGTEVVGFGFSVVIDQEWMAISAPWVNDNAGTTFTYRYNGTHWNFFRELAPLSNVKGSFYGKTQVLHNGWLMVSHEGADINLQDKSGSVYLYQWTGIDWGLRTIIHPETPEEDAFFGSCIGFDMYNLAVGARGKGNAGSVYVFEYNHTSDFYEEKHELVYPVEFHIGAEFGYDCDLIDEVLVAGATKGSGNTGDVNFFRLEDGQWVHKQTIEPISQVTISGAKFGTSLDMMRSPEDYILLLIGAPDALDLNGYVNGAASIYNYNNFTTDPCFTHQETFFANDPSGVNRQMGIKVQLINNTQAMVLSDRNDQLYFYGAIDSYTTKPTSAPTDSPTVSPTGAPTVSPSVNPTISPSRAPTETGDTARPTLSPVEPTHRPTRSPTSSTTTGSPTRSPTATSREDPSPTRVAVIAAAILGSALAICIAWGFLADRRRRRNEEEDGV